MPSINSRLITACLLGMILGVTGNSYAQEKPSYYYDVLGEASVGLVLPQALGDGFIKEGYTLDPGVQFKAGILVDPKLVLGVDLQLYSGQVTEPTLVGNYRGTNFRRLLVFGQYNLLPVKSDLALRLGLQGGYIYHGNYTETERFRDDGYSLGIQSELSYRFSTTFGLYLQAQWMQEWLNIKTAESVQSEFDSVQSFIPGFGLRVYIR